MSPAAEAVIRRLDAARQQWWLCTLLTTTVLAVCFSFAIMLVFTLLDALVVLSQAMLGLLLAVWATATLAAVLVVARRLLRSQRDLAAMARRVEMELPELGSHLINLVQLVEHQANGDAAFCAAAADRAAAEIGATRLSAAAAKEPRWRRLRHCMQTPRDLAEALAVLLLLAAIACAAWRSVAGWGSAASRLLTPWQFVPAVGRVEIVNVTPGNTQVMIGSTLEIAAEITNPEARPYKAVLLVASAGQPRSAMPMSPDAQNRHYKCTLPAILEPLTYRLEIGDSQTGIFQVGVREKPAVQEVKITYHFPAYLGRPDESLLAPQADLSAPQYTIVELRVHACTPVAGGHILLGKLRLDGRVEESGQWLVLDRLPLLSDGSFTIHLENDAGHSDPNPRINRIQVVVDEPPTVELIKPPRQSSLAPGAVLPVTLRAADDHALSEVRLEMKVQRQDALPAEGEGKIAVVRTWTMPDNARTVVEHHSLDLKSQKIAAGQTVLLRAVARDRRLFNDLGLDLKPQETAGPWHAVRIVAAESQEAADLEELENLRAAMMKILERQIGARSDAVKLFQSSLGIGKVRTAQVDIQREALDLCKRHSVLEVGRIANPSYDNPAPHGDLSR
ncbi:MAG: hypothetical protein ABSG68_02665, partial [Thermoguttaceae bacterium]